MSSAKANRVSRTSSPKKKKSERSYLDNPKQPRHKRIQYDTGSEEEYSESDKFASSDRRGRSTERDRKSRKYRTSKEMSPPKDVRKRSTSSEHKKRKRGSRSNSPREQYQRRRRELDTDESESEEESEYEESVGYTEIAVDKSRPAPVQYRDVIEKDASGNPIIVKPGEAKRVEPIPASDSQQMNLWKHFQKLLKKHNGKIPLVYPEKGNRLYHNENFAYIYELPVKGSVATIKMGMNTEPKPQIGITNPPTILSAIKKLRGKPSKIGKDGRERSAGGKAWVELYLPDLDGIYKRLGVMIPVNCRPVKLPNPSLRLKKRKVEDSGQENVELFDEEFEAVDVQPTDISEEWKSIKDKIEKDPELKNLVTEWVKESISKSQ